MNAGLPLVEELVPCPDPWEIAQKLSHLPHLLFLDSSQHQPFRGRYSYVTADPLCTMSENDLAGEPLAMPRVKSIPELPPFQGGYAGLFSYEFGRRFERLPLPQHDEFRFPDTTIFCYDWVIAFDHLQQRAWLISTGESRNE